MQLSRLPNEKDLNKDKFRQELNFLQQELFFYLQLTTLVLSVTTERFEGQPSLFLSLELEEELFVLPLL